MIKLFKFYTILIIFLIASNFKSSAQIDFYQDVFYGGVTGDGYSSYNLETTNSIDIYIEPGSVIRKAFLFATSWSVNNEPVIERIVVFNNDTLYFNRSVDFTGGEFHAFYYGSNFFTANVLYKDVTNLISPITSSYMLTPPSNQDPTMFNGGLLGDFYLLVLYENPSLRKVGTSIYINNQNAQQTLLFNLKPQLNFKITNDIGFTFNSNSIGDVTSDGSDIYIENVFIGAVGGTESVIEPAWSGVRGAFYYQDSTLFELDNDVANTMMNGIDALAEISTYLTNTDSLNIIFEYQSPGVNGDDSNPIHELFLTYTTPCDTFSVSTPNDTTVCYGTQLQLNVTGGQKYEWLPSTGLSCDTCANPIFSADSTMHYTVRIWNNDSCSVVHPLQILVSQPKIENVAFIQPDCGAANGQLSLGASSFSWLPMDYSIDNGVLQADSFFVNLTEGNYLLRAEDSLGCFADTLVFLQAVNNTVAQFNTTAGSTEVPVTVWGENQSQNATTYSWWVDGVFFSNTEDILPIFNTTGTHTIELIAWQYDPSCADTALVEFTIQHQIIVPTAFTPDGDGNNDFWEILYLDEVYPENQVFVYNRWGNLVYSSDKGDYNGRPWRGDFEGKNVAVGSYFYVIELGVSATLDNLVSSDKNFLQEEADKLKGSVSVVWM